MRADGQRRGGEARRRARNGAGPERRGTVLEGDGSRWRRPARERLPKSARPLRFAGCSGSSCLSAPGCQSPFDQYSHLWPHLQCSRTPEQSARLVPLEGACDITPCAVAAQPIRASGHRRCIIGAIGGDWRQCHAREGNTQSVTTGEASRTLARHAGGPVRARGNPPRP